MSDISTEVKTKAVKRIEMVMHKHVIEEIEEKLNENKVSGYTIIPDVLGRGERGLHSSISLGALQYYYLLLSCDEKDVEMIVDIVNPYLNSYGGMCLVSDASWVVHRGADY